MSPRIRSPWHDGTSPTLDLLQGPLVMKHRPGGPGATVRYITFAVRRARDMGRGTRAATPDRLTMNANQIAPMGRAPVVTVPPRS